MNKRPESKMIIMKFDGPLMRHAERIHRLIKIHLKGTDKIIPIWTDRYGVSPNVIDGTWASTAVTTSGILTDVISISNF